jgi:antitoxin component YwqK of YwqJK toxin-antitoxin module
MKKIIIISLLSLYIACLNSQPICIDDLEIKDGFYWHNEVIYTGGYNCFDNNGILRLNGYVRDGLLDGITEYYDKNGTLAEMIWYKENQEVQRRLFKNVTTSKLVITLKDNQEHGLWERYFPSGQIQERKYYDQGKPTGFWTTWDNRGRIIIESDFTNDTIVTKYHGYRKNRHKIIIHYIDKETNKRIKKEKTIIE